MSVVLCTMMRDLARLETETAAAKRSVGRVIAVLIDSTVRSRRITLTALAEEIGITKAHLCDVRHGRRFSPRVAEYFAAAREGGEGTP